MNTTMATALFSFLSVAAALAQSAPKVHTPPVKTTYVQLARDANAIIIEPVVPGPKSRIAILHTHPNINNFNSFIGQELSQRGYRVMLLNYYGPELIYEEYLAPIAAAVRHLRSVPGVEKVVFATHSTGGPELTFYQDVAENGSSACQAPERVYPCGDNDLTGLPPADGVMLLDINIGAAERVISIDPAVDRRKPAERNPALDMFDPRNGFDVRTKGASYTAEFTQRFYAAQGARNNRLIDEALTRLAKIEKGEGDYKDDEPFVIPGVSVNANGARLNLADTRIFSKTRAPHRLLKGDGTTSVQIVPSVLPPVADPAELGMLLKTTQNLTVRSYLSYLGLRTTDEYAMTENAMRGIVWRSSANSAPGNVEGVTVPTLIMAATCASHLILLEVVFDHSAARDKELVGVEGANHGFQPCEPEYGNTRKRTFDYVDSWLGTSGRF